MNMLFEEVMIQRASEYDFTRNGSLITCSAEDFYMYLRPLCEAKEDLTIISKLEGGLA